MGVQLVVGVDDPYPLHELHGRELGLRAVGDFEGLRALAGDFHGLLKFVGIGVAGLDDEGRLEDLVHVPLRGLDLGEEDAEDVDEVDDGVGGGRHHGYVYFHGGEGAHIERQQGKYIGSLRYDFLAVLLAHDLLVLASTRVLLLLQVGIEPAHDFPESFSNDGALLCQLVQYGDNKPFHVLLLLQILVLVLRVEDQELFAEPVDELVDCLLQVGFAQVWVGRRE